MTLIALPSNRPAERFYRGGAKIAAFRGESAAPRREPEDWVASTTSLAGQCAVGRTVLPDGRVLADAIASDAQHWLGAEHVRRYGRDTKLLVKLLDAQERLPVHAHPHVDFATKHLGRAHGKAEAWYILHGGSVHLGLIDDADPAEVARLVASQNTQRLLGLLHEVQVAPGDVVYVPPGMLHAIGAGLFLIEVQEPEDLSILLEWHGFALDGANDGHLGLGFDTALAAVELTARTPPQIDALIRRAHGGDLLPEEASGYFRLEHIAVHDEVEIGRGFSVLVVTEGAFRWGALALPRGATVLVPFAAGDVLLEGHGEIVVARPPRA